MTYLCFKCIFCAQGLFYLQNLLKIKPGPASTLKHINYQKYVISTGDSQDVQLHFLCPSAARNVLSLFLLPINSLLFS